MSEWRVENDVKISWRLLNEERGIDATFRIPACVLEILQDQKIIKDPLYRYGEAEYAWVGKTEWNMVGKFSLTTQQEGRSQMDLVMDGIDTCASIYLNGKHLADVSNMHRKYYFPVQEHIMKGAENVIQIKLKSAILEAEARSKEYPYPCPTVTQGVYMHYNFLRKAACDFGWDWGPGFGQCGILGNVRLRACSLPYVTEFHVCQSWIGDDVTLHPKVTIRNPSRSTCDGALVICSEELGIRKVSKLTVGIEDTHEILMDPIQVSKGFEKWWPHDMGCQCLYKIEAFFGPPAGGGGVDQEKISRKIGFRCVKLVREPLPNGDEGESFYFEVNGTPIFAKGANMIPLNINPSKVITDDYRGLVNDAKEANMNMIRIWGGGHYAPSAFYEACDELGILVWQEFMFACAMYPRDDKFLGEVREEVKYQAMRLGSHASVVVWGGNNECEDALPWFSETRANSPLYIVDMCKLFADVVKTALEQVNPHVPFLDTSPSNGVISFNPYVKRFGKVSNPQFGDVHFYNYKDNCLDHTIYPRAKFISEFGFQSYPSFSEYKEVSSPEDWSYGSKLSSFRQRHPNGNEELKAQMEQHFFVPPEKDIKGNPQAQKQLFKKWIYLTQLQQALCYNTAVCYWRTLRNDPVALTRGALYWQLNDIWQGPSWSSINVKGTWKLLHYMAKKFFSPLLVSARIEAEKTLNVHLVNDLTEDLRVYTEVMMIPLGNEASKQAICVIPFQNSIADLDAGQVKSILDLPIHSVLQGQGLNPRNCLLYVSSTGASRDDSPKARSQDKNPSTGCFSDAVILLAPWKEMQFQDPQVNATNFQRSDNKTIKFTLVTSAVVPHVGLESSLTGKFSKNVLLLLPWSPQEVIFRAKDPIAIEELESSLDIHLPVTEGAGGDWVMIDDDFV